MCQPNFRLVPPIMSKPFFKQVWSYDYKKDCHYLSWVIYESREQAKEIAKEMKKPGPISPHATKLVVTNKFRMYAFKSLEQAVYFCFTVSEHRL